MRAQRAAPDSLDDGSDEGDDGSDQRAQKMRIHMAQLGWFRWQSDDEFGCGVQMMVQFGGWFSWAMVQFGCEVAMMVQDESDGDSVIGDLCRVVT